MNSTGHRITGIETEAELQEFQAFIQDGGYSAFHELLEDFKQQVKQMHDEETALVRASLQTAKRLFPEPGRFSPSWTEVWEELEQMVDVKSKLLQTIPPEERVGEWQVILDNPLTTQGVVCHPGLTFHEAAYLYSYFRPGLERNEYMRLQKIQTSVSDVGN